MSEDANPALSHSEVARRPQMFTVEGVRRAHLVPVIVLVLLFVSNIYDAGGTLGVKYAAFVVALVASLSTLKYFCLSSRAIAAGLLLFVVWPAWSLLYGAVRGGDMSVGTSQVTPFLFALVIALILPAFDNKLPSQLFYACLFSLAIVVIVSFALIFLLPDNFISERLFETLTSLHEQEGYFGTRTLGEIDVPTIYFYSSLFLVPAFVYYLFADRILRAGIVLLALGVTFSKAGISIALGFGAIYSVLALFPARDPDSSPQHKTKNRTRSRRLLPLLLVGTFAIAILLAFPGFSEQLQDTYAGESESALIRKGHIESVLNLLTENPRYLLLGQGVGVPFFSSGESDYVQSIEVDHLNTIRKFGLPWFVAFSAIVFLSAWKLIKVRNAEMRACGFALVSMYLAAGTNPVLISPLFVILMMLSYFAQSSNYARAS